MIYRNLPAVCFAVMFSIYAKVWTHDYFPIKKGNGWFYVDVSGGQRLDFFYSCVNSIIRNGRTYYVMQHFLRETGKTTCSDTLYKDTLGNVWRYGVVQDTLWFDFFEDTTADYKYGKFSVKKSIADTIITPSGTYKQCLCFTFVDSVNNGYRYIFMDSIGMIVHTQFFWGNIGTGTRLKSAEVNDTIIGIPTNANDYFPLQKGNKWIYHRISAFADTLIHEIIDTTTIDGKIYFHLTISTVLGERREEYFLRKDTITENVYKRVGQQDELFNTVDLSIFEGEPYFYKSSLSDSAVGSWREATHTVPAGKFHYCRYYKMDNQPEMYDDEYYYVYAPCVGLIADHNDGSIPWLLQLLYAVIDGKQIGQVVEIKTAYKPVLKHEKTFEKFLLINGSNLIRFHQSNQESKIFTINGRAVGNSNVSRIKAAKLSRGYYILKTKNNQLFPIKESNLTFGYFYDGHWKIYRPHGDKKTKWIPNNVPITAMDGKENIKDCDVAFINKSKKDYMVMKKVFPCSCAVQNEGMACFSTENVEYLKANSNRQILSFDSDAPGVKNSQQITKLFEFDYCNVPKTYLKEGIKDWADFAKEYGMKAIERHLKQKKLL